MCSGSSSPLRYHRRKWFFACICSFWHIILCFIDHCSYSRLKIIWKILHFATLLPLRLRAQTHQANQPEKWHIGRWGHGCFYWDIGGFGNMDGVHVLQFWNLKDYFTLKMAIYTVYYSLTPCCLEFVKKTLVFSHAWWQTENPKTGNSWRI